MSSHHHYTIASVALSAGQRLQSLLRSPRAEDIEISEAWVHGVI